MNRASDRNLTERAQPGPSSAQRFAWLDSIKGIAMLWIVFFHFFITFAGDRYPWNITPSNIQSFVDGCAPTGLVARMVCWLEALIVVLIQGGPYAVSVFILFSGFGLTYSLVKKGKEPDWPTWYRKRIWRLFPIYWLAHLICLVSPFLYLQSPIDYRFVLSFLGDRIIPVDKMFFYLNPSWWFFGLLLQLYIVFPLLYRLLQKLGPAKFLMVGAAFAAATRYFLNWVIYADGNWAMGAFFGARVWEFAAGMSLGSLLARHPGKTLERLFSARGFIAGVFLFALGVWSYQPSFTFCFSDGLIGMGLSIILAHLSNQLNRIPILAGMFSFVGLYSYSVYLFHQPYVMYAGEKLHGTGIWVYLTLGSAIVAAVVAGAAYVEWSVNRGLERLTQRFSKPQTVRAGL